MKRSTEKETRRLSQSIDRMVPAPVRGAITALLPATSKALIRSMIQSLPAQWLNHVLERRADRRYRTGKRATTLDEIRAALRGLPLSDHTVVFVHSSMSKLGYVEGGAANVVNALCDVIVRERKSTVAVPTFSMTGGMADTLRADEVFDLRNTPSGTGRITELVRRHPGARRSLHPTHSVAAVGPRAAWLVDGHHLDARTFGPSSPFARLIEADGFILGLGIDLGPVTFYHVVEDLGAFPINVYTSDSPLVVTCLDGHGKRVELKVFAHDPSASITRIDRANGAAIRSYMTTVAETGAGLTWHQIGDGRMWLVSARRLYHCLVRLKDRGITIFATAEEVGSFPPAASVCRSGLN
jgi:aminoglycoside N3'-acetyltransferase